MFVNTHLFSPIVLDNFRYPDKDSFEFDAFWDEERRRCIQGYTVGGVTITGKHYWYLNYWPIYGTNEKTGRKGLIRPRFTDLDFEKFALLERMYVEEKDCMFLKSRQKGFSEWIASVCAYELNFFAGSQVVIVAGQASYSEKTFANLKRGLDDQSSTEFYKERKPDNLDYFRFAFNDEEILSNGKKIKKVSGLMSEAYCLTALTNTQVVSRLSPTFIVYEEIGKWKQKSLLETKGYVDPSLMALRKKTGYSVFIGTGGDMDDSIPDVMEMFYNPEAHNLLTFNNEYEDDAQNTKVACFVPAWKFEVMDKDGNSLREESIAAIKSDRNKKRGSDKIKAITQKPFTPSEAFMISTEGFFGEEIITELNTRRAQVINHREELKAQRGILKWKDRMHPSQGVEWEPRENGWCIVFEHPQLDSKNNPIDYLYKVATDSYDKDEATYSTSQGACQVLKSFYNADSTYNKFVARITERPTTEEGGAELFYEHTAMLTMYYNGINLIEWSNTRIFDWYVTKNLTHLLKERPKFVTSSWVGKSAMTNRYGIDPATKVFWLGKTRDWLTKENIAKMEDIEQIEALARFRYDPAGKKYNCDITISTSLCIVCLEDEKEMVAEASNAVKEYKFLSYKTSNTGQLITSF